MVSETKKRDFALKKIKIGTRGSPLALAQAFEVKKKIISSSNLLEDSIEVITIDTKGDKIQDRPLTEIGGKGLFTEEIESKLLNKEIDLAVHSMKDMPTIFPEGLAIKVFLKREDFRDSFVSLNYKAIGDLPKGAVVGSSSLRRRAQLLHKRPDIKVVEFRGNVQTRLKKLEDGVADATFLASAGLLRLGMKQLVNPISPDIMMPAVAQGVIGVQQRKDDKQMASILAPLNDEDTEVQVLVERAFLDILDGSCRTPIGAFCRLEGGSIFFKGEVLRVDGSEVVSGSWKGSLSDPVELGQRAGKDLKEKIGDSFF